MDLIFIKVLNMSISASWLVMAVLGLRWLLKKSPRWIHVALWGLVALRLICPWSPESEVSLVPEKTTEHMVQSLSGGYYGDAMIYSQGSWEYDAAVAAGITPSVGGNDYHYVLTQPDDPTKPAHTAATFFGQIWIVGMVLMFAWALVSYLKLRKKVSASLALDNGVYLCDYIDTPFILGILSPKIYLPSSMEPDSASHVLAHERAHIARKDHWWKPLGYLLLTVHWFNPILWLAYILLCRDIELACDEKVVREMALPERKAYSDALLRCSVSRRHIAACPLAFGEVGVKERVKTVLHYKKPAFWIVLIAILALIVTAVCFLTDPVTDEPETTEPSGVSGESPYGWTSTVEVWNIRKAWAYPYVQAAYSQTIEGSKLEELVDLFNGIGEGEIVARKPVGENDPFWNYDGTGVHLYCNDGTSVWLRYVDDTAILGTISDPDTWVVEGYWAVENDALTQWLERMANGGTWMLSDDNRDEIRRLVRQEHVQFFSPQEYEDMLFVGCAYDNGRGLGVACFEKVAYGYKLRKLIRDEEVKQCASGGDLYYCDFNSLRIFLVMNESVTGMEWAGSYEAVHTIDTHPGLVVEYFPQNLGSMYRFIYIGGSTTMYMDWQNETHAQVPDYTADLFANPDDAHSICAQVQPEQVDYVSATEILEVDERFNQACSYRLKGGEMEALTKLLNSLPETVFEPAVYPENIIQMVDIVFWNYTGMKSVTPFVTLGLQDGVVYFRFSYSGMPPFRTWKIDDSRLTEYLESFFAGDTSTWEKFSPYPKSEESVSFETHGVKITIPKILCFEYELTEQGIRFKPEEEESWVELQYLVEPFAVCGTGLKTSDVIYGGHFGTKGVYDNNEYWSFMDLKPTLGDVAYNIVLLNEDTWVEEYDREMYFLLNLITFEVIE